MCNAAIKLKLVDFFTVYLIRMANISDETSFLIKNDCKRH